jgi:alpha-tubulin suppressor-like RCC1 family protein
MSAIPVKVAGLGSVKSVGAGDNHVCALLSNGTVSCWGASGDGQLGNGILPVETGGVYSATPVAVTGLPAGITAIDAGYNTTCALVGGSGAVYCWGNNIYGQLGTSAPAVAPTDINASATPIKIAGLGVATAISVNAAVCATVGGSLMCWGNNSEGESAQPIPNNTSFASPAYVSGLNMVQAVSTGDRATCTVLAGGNVDCWGSNAYGQLGDPSTPVGDNVPTPTRVQGLSTGATQVSTGYLHSCALLTTGKVWCWGVERNGALGNGVAADDGYPQAPVAVSNLSGVKSISVAALHGCALLNNGSVQCWGEGAAGQLGNGAAANATVPVMVTGW